MEKFRKNINWFGMVMVACMAISFTASAFTAPGVVATRFYFYDADGSGPQTAQWHEEEPDSGMELECSPNEDAICSAEFESAPDDPTSNLKVDNPNAIPTSINEGNYVQLP